MSTAWRRWEGRSAAAKRTHEQISRAEVIPRDVCERQTLGFDVGANERRETNPRKRKNIRQHIPLPSMHHSRARKAERWKERQMSDIKQQILSYWLLQLEAVWPTTLGQTGWTDMNMRRSWCTEDVFPDFFPRTFPPTLPWARSFRLNTLNYDGEQTSSY